MLDAKSLWNLGAFAGSYHELSTIPSPDERFGYICTYRCTHLNSSILRMFNNLSRTGYHYQNIIDAHRIQLNYGEPIILQIIPFDLMPMSHNFPEVLLSTR